MFKSPGDGLATVNPNQKDKSKEMKPIKIEKPKTIQNYYKFETNVNDGEENVKREDKSPDYLGNGKFGIVYKAKHAKLDRTYALKILNQNAMDMN